MELNKDFELQSRMSGSVNKKAVLSEDTLRQLSKSLTKVFPNNVDNLEDVEIAYEAP